MCSGNTFLLEQAKENSSINNSLWLQGSLDFAVLRSKANAAELLSSSHGTAFLVNTQGLPHGLWSSSHPTICSFQLEVWC